MAWYEGTTDTQAEIVTLKLDEEMIQAAKRNLSHFDIDDRVKLVEGPAQATIPNLTGHFDLIFIDANKDSYQGYIKQILDLKLLSPGGVILCDNGKAQVRFRVTRDSYANVSYCSVRS